MEFNDAKNELVKKYCKYGFTPDDFEKMMKKGIDNYGLSIEAVFNGLRMSLSTSIAPDENEYFSVEDVMSMTGETREEVIQRINEMGYGIVEHGNFPYNCSKMEQSPKGAVYYLPNGIKK